MRHLFYSLFYDHGPGLGGTMACLTTCPSWGRRAGGTVLGQWSHRMVAGAKVLATATTNGASVLIARARVGLQQRERTGERGEGFGLLSSC